MFLAVFLVNEEPTMIDGEMVLSLFAFTLGAALGGVVVLATIYFTIKGGQK